jgi:hypothetical protein
VGPFDRAMDFKRKKERRSAWTGKSAPPPSALFLFELMEPCIKYKILKEEETVEETIGTPLGTSKNRS